MTVREIRGHLQEQYRPYIVPGKPMQNGLVDSFVGRVHDECLNGHMFSRYRNAGKIAQGCGTDYNSRRTYASLQELTPVEVSRGFRADHQQKPLTYE